MIKSIKTIFALLMVCSAISAQGVNITENRWRVTPGLFSFDSFMISHTPGGEFYTMFIENYVPDATFLTEETNGFALLDTPRVYFEGDSINQFNWHWNGLNINSSLNDGSPALIAPLSAVSGMEIHGDTPGGRIQGFNFVSPIARENHSSLTASYVHPGMGGTLARFMIQPEHPFERADQLYETRRKFVGDYRVNGLWTRNSGQSHTSASVDYIHRRRRFNDFSDTTLRDKTFDESGSLLSGQIQFARSLENGQWKVFGLFNHLTRSNQDAELGAPPGETADKDRYAALAGFHLEKKLWNVNVALLWEKERLGAVVPNFSKELLDTDGDGFYPFYGKLGKFSAFTVMGNLDIRAITGALKLKLFADTRYSSLSGDETPNSWNAMTIGGAPWLVMRQTSPGAYNNVNADARIGGDLDWRLTEDISLQAKGYLQYNHLTFGDSRNNLKQLTPGFDVGLSLFRNKRFNILFAYGRLPYDLRENVNTFLETSRPGGAYYRWRDRNNDRMFDPSEMGAVYGYTGGAVHFLDPGVSAPLKERWLLMISIPVSRALTLDIKGMYKHIVNNFRVRFTEEYGLWEKSGERDIYWFNRPFSNYQLTNNYLEKDPFYAQLLLHLYGGRTGKWFFSFSFLAHMGMGDTAFGNGPGANDIGILHESQADPNSWRNGFGRVDGDRGFVAKSFFGFHLNRALFMGVSFKYRDGDPFAFINTYHQHRQYILQYATIKAEDEKGKKGGPREDYLGDLSLSLNYSCHFLGKPALISVGIFNILDVGCELSEYVFSGGERDSREIQIPRSLRLTLQWTL